MITNRHKVVALAMAIVALAAGCFELDSNDMSGLGADSVGGYYAVIRDTDGQHNEPCTYNVDPGCFQQDNNGNGFRIAYDAVGPNGENVYRGRELPMVDINDTAGPCGATDPVTGQPGAGWPGFGGFTPSTTACIDYVISEVTDDPSDPNDDSSYVCANGGNSCHDAFGTTAAGTDPKDTARTNWIRHFFDVSTLGLATARYNAQRWIWAMRDFYLVIITDPSISGMQATGHAGCIQMADNPASGDKIKLGRWCF